MSARQQLGVSGDLGPWSLPQCRQGSSALADAQRGGVSIAVSSKTRMATRVPTTRPVAMVDTSRRLCHVIGFMHEQRSTKKATPAAVVGAEIWVNVGDAALANPSELTPRLGHQLAVPGPIHWRATRQEGPLHAPVGQHPR